MNEDDNFLTHRPLTPLLYLQCIACSEYTKGKCEGMFTYQKDKVSEKQYCIQQPKEGE